MDWSDKRSIDEMPFGGEAPPEKREEVAKRVRELLHHCGVQVADDIGTLGCTGCAAHGISIEEAKLLRMGLAGGGVGLACFVPLVRYCLIHETIGGLEPGQHSNYPEEILGISRELTSLEAVRVTLVQSARRTEGPTGTARIASASDVLAGRTLPEDFLEAVGADSADAAPPAPASSVPAPPAPAPPAPAPAEWKCPEHATLTWTCRYCVAQAVVEGPFEPRYAVAAERLANGEVFDVPIIDGIDAAQLTKELTSADTDECTGVQVYVLAARFTRKLSRA